MDPFSTVKDSSIWQSSSNFSFARGKDAYVRLGIIQKAYEDSSSGELRYLVTMFDRSDEIPLNCRLLRRFGGVYNYEDMVYQGYTYTDGQDPVSSLQAKAGDIVLVAMLNGEAREGIILGGVQHAARASTISINNGPQYMSEFNGIQTIINQDGEYIITFRGIPTNIKELAQVPSGPIPPPTYNSSFGSSFFKLDKTGSTIAAAGPVSMKLTSNGKVAIGSSSVELFDQITQALMDIISFLNQTDSTHTHIGNMGYPTAPPQQASDFTALASKLQTIHDALTSIKGSL